MFVQDITSPSVLSGCIRQREELAFGIVGVAIEMGWVVRRRVALPTTKYDKIFV